MEDDRPCHPLRAHDIEQHEIAGTMGSLAGADVAVVPLGHNDGAAGETWVYPGHGADTPLGNERASLGEWRARGW